MHLREVLGDFRAMLGSLDFAKLLDARAGLVRSLAPGQNFPDLPRVEAEHRVWLKVEVLVDLVGGRVLILSVRAYSLWTALQGRKERLVGRFTHNARCLGILNRKSVIFEGTGCVRLA